MKSDIKNKIERVYDMFDSSFIYKGEELILHKKWNVYFRLPDIKDGIYFDYKLLSYCSFYTASHHFNKNTAQCKYFWNRLNRWFKKEFTYEELQAIYQKLGCGANRKLGNEFIKSGLNIDILSKGE